jgi:predicted nucleic-acid-binding protein
MVGSIKKNKMMKKFISKITFIAFVSVLGVSCDWDDTNYEDMIGDYNPNSTFYVQFNDAGQ